jgi:hypothetical protein
MAEETPMDDAEKNASSPPTTTATKRELTQDEQDVIDMVARRQGREWAESHIELILGQYHSI